MTIETDQLFAGFAEGDFNWLYDELSISDSNEEQLDDLSIARFARKSPAEILTNLSSKGFVKLFERLHAPQFGSMHIPKDAIFPSWSVADNERFTIARAQMYQEDEKVITYKGELVNPDDPTQTKNSTH